MPVVFGLSALLTVRRSGSVYRSFSALAALIRLSYSLSYIFHNVYTSFAADGCIFKLETLARSLVDTCAEKEYLLALVDLGRAVFMTKYWPFQRYDDTIMRTELRDAISLQQYVPSPPTQSYLNTLSPERPLSLQKHTQDQFSARYYGNRTRSYPYATGIQLSNRM